MRTTKTLNLFIFCTFLLGSIYSHADEHKNKSAIAQAVTADIRTEQERARDESRKPIETLEFFGIEEDMRVLELLPGGGWYTKILSNILSDKGELYVAISTRRLDFEQPWLKNVRDAGTGYEFERVGTTGFIANLSPGDFGVKNLDMVLTFRNAHNLTDPARTKLNADVFAALAPGGVYGVIDHTKRHMEPLKEATWRRADPVLIIKEALDAGFIFEGYSNVHYRPTDTLEFDSQHETVKGDSDRFTFKFRKPE